MKKKKDFFEEAENIIRECEEQIKELEQIANVISDEDSENEDN
jgi:exonuclease VII small subunit